MRYLATAGLLLAVVVCGCKKKAEGPKTTEIEPDLQPMARTIEPVEAPRVETIEPARARMVDLTALAPDEAVGPPLPGTYTVKKGDTLWSIATRLLGDGQRWRDIVAMNPGLVPEKLRIGQQIAIPDK